MITHILSITSPETDVYDDLYPTKQTELLCLELRKILYGFDGATIRHAETTDVTALETTFNALFTGFVSDEEAAVDALESSLPIPLPGNMPDIIGDLSGLVLAGVANPVLAVVAKLALPVLGRLIARKMGVPGYAGDSDISPQLETIAERIAPTDYAIANTVEELRTMLEATLWDRDGSVLKTYVGDDGLEGGTSVFCGITALNERLSAFARMVEELQAIMESKAVSIMHTSQSDKVVYIPD